MLQLMNLSNHHMDNELIGNNPERLEALLTRYKLDGLEMMFCAPWDSNLHKPEWMQGCHLRFWPWWLDFWRGDLGSLLKQFGTLEEIINCYGGITREAWLNIYRDNIRTAAAAGVKYLVFHVSNARVQELFSWQFSADSREVIAATIEVINSLAPDIPENIALLFENLWWPGLTLTDKELTAMLLDNVTHRNVGIMLDTGHLMNTNPYLKTEEEGVEYILHTVENLGSYARFVRGIHLHQSLSGKYILDSQKNANQSKPEYSMEEVMHHVLQMDAHRPFTTPAVQKIITHIRPEFLVHEFTQRSQLDWEQKLSQQIRALYANRTKI